MKMKKRNVCVFSHVQKGTPNRNWSVNDASCSVYHWARRARSDVTVVLGWDKVYSSLCFCCWIGERSTTICEHYLFRRLFNYQGTPPLNCLSGCYRPRGCYTCWYQIIPKPLITSNYHSYSFYWCFGDKWVWFLVSCPCLDFPNPCLTSDMIIDCHWSNDHWRQWIVPVQ